MQNNTYLLETLETEKLKLAFFLKEDKHNYEEIVSIINSIIDLKILLKYNQADSIYIDFKKMIKYYLLAVDNKECGYDKVNVGLICDKINRLKLNERQNLLFHFKRELLRNSFLDESDECDDYIYSNKILLLKSNKGLKNKIKLVFYISSRNLKSLILSFLIIFLVIYLIQLKAPFEFMVFFEKKYATIHSNIFLNDLSNIFLILLNIDNNVTLIPKNIIAVVFLGFIKIVYITIFINYFWKKIIYHIKIK